MFKIWKNFKREKLTQRRNFDFSPTQFSRNQRIILIACVSFEKVPRIRICFPEILDQNCRSSKNRTCLIAFDSWIKQFFEWDACNQNFKLILMKLFFKIFHFSGKYPTLKFKILFRGLHKFSEIGTFLYF